MNGFLNINKPSGITSHDVVTRVKRVINAKKVGHTGTLDPFATGVLPLCINDATSFARFFENDNKEYIALMKLGEETDTYDIDGKVINTHALSDIVPEDIISILKGFIRGYMQTPPMYSAKKKHGVPLYKLARNGIDVFREPKAVHIYEIDIIEITIPYIRFRVVCSKGTYIRALCHDVGQRLGCGAYLSSLQRIRSGRFKVENSLSLDAVSSDAISDKVITMEDMFQDVKSIFLDEKGANSIMNGIIPKSSLNLFEDGALIKFMFDDKIAAIGEFREGRLKLIKVFRRMERGC